MKLVNREMAGQKFSTAVGIIECDDKGCCECDDKGAIAVLMAAGFKEVVVAKKLPTPKKPMTTVPAPTKVASKPAPVKAERSEKAEK